MQVPLSDELRFAPADLCILLYLVLRAGRLRLDRRDWTVWHPLLVFVIAAGALVGQLTIGLDPTTLIAKVVGLGLLFAGLVCLLDFMRNVERIRWLFRVYAMAVTAHVVVFLAVMLLQNTAGFDGWGLNLGGARLAGLLVDPNAFGGLIAVALVMTVWLRGPLRLFDWGYRNVVSVILLAGLLFTFSRSAWIGLLFAAAAGVALQPRRTGEVLRAAVPLVLIGGMVIAVTILPFVTDLAARPDQVEGRFEIIQESIEDLQSSPVVGIGLGGAYDRHERIVHNTTLFFLTEFGPFGFIVILGLMGSYVVRAWRARQLLPAAQVQLAPTLAGAHAAMFGVSMGIEALYQRHWWVVFAGLGATYRMALAGPAAQRLAAVQRVATVSAARQGSALRSSPRTTAAALATTAARAPRRRVDPPKPVATPADAADTAAARHARRDEPSTLLSTLRRFFLLDAEQQPASPPAPAAPNASSLADALRSHLSPTPPPAVSKPSVLTDALRFYLAPSADPQPTMTPTIAAPDRTSASQLGVPRLVSPIGTVDGPQTVQPGRAETGRHAFWGIVDQAASSGTNFALTLAVAASVSAADFGAFSVASVLFIVFIGVWRSLNCEPITMMHATNPAALRSAGSQSLAVTWMAGCAAGLALVLVAQATPAIYRPSLQILGVALPLLLVQDAARMLSFALLQARPAAINDMAWGAALIAAVVGIVVVAPDASSSVYLGAWAATGAAAGLLLLAQLHIRPRLGGEHSARENLRLGLPLLANYALSTLPPYLLFLVMPAVAGLTELGVLRAGYVPYGPFGVLLQGAPLVALPLALRSAGRRAAVRLAGKLSLLLMAIAAAWGLFINLLLPDAVGSWILGDLWELTDQTRLIFAGVIVLEAAGVGPLLALRALKVPHRLVIVRVVTGPIILGGGLLLMRTNGAEGAAIAFFVTHAVTLVLAWLQVRVELQRPERAEPNPAAQLTGRNG